MPTPPRPTGHNPANPPGPAPTGQPRPQGYGQLAPQLRMPTMPRLNIDFLNFFGPRSSNPAGAGAPSMGTPAPAPAPAGGTPPATVDPGGLTRYQDPAARDRYLRQRQRRNDMRRTAPEGEFAMPRLERDQLAPDPNYKRIGFRDADRYPHRIRNPEPLFDALGGVPDAFGGRGGMGGDPFGGGGAGDFFEFLDALRRMSGQMSNNGGQPYSGR